MSIELRDHLAALAMASLIQTNEDLMNTNYTEDSVFAKEIVAIRVKAAKVAYSIADAMIAVRDGVEGSIYEEPGNLSL